MTCRMHTNKYSALHGQEMCAVCHMPASEQGSPPSDAPPWKTAAEKAIEACGQRPGGHRWHLDSGAGGSICLDCGARRRDVEPVPNPHTAEAGS
ncbi:MAG: hypothetical protein OXK17_08405 [Thaumarchaeota archaeon]|nr:hypothetical protein [Nitrososphaerota archaeon]